MAEASISKNRKGRCIMLPEGVNSMYDLDRLGFQSISWNDFRDNAFRKQTNIVYKEAEEFSVRLSKKYEWSEDTHYTTKTLAAFLRRKPSTVADYLCQCKDKGAVRVQYSDSPGNNYTWVIPKDRVFSPDLRDACVTSFTELEKRFNVPARIISKLGLHVYSDGVSTIKYYKIAECEEKLKQKR